jgi:hypothetical protein
LGLSHTHINIPVNRSEGRGERGGEGKGMGGDGRGGNRRGTEERERKGRGGGGQQTVYYPSAKNKKKLKTEHQTTKFNLGA